MANNANSKTYGYASLKQLLADSTRFGNDPEHPLTHWISYKDADGDLRFVPCTEEVFHFWRNEERNEERRKDIESRCMVKSEKYGLVKCRADCYHCPYKQDKDHPETITSNYERIGMPISIDFMSDNFDYDFSSEDTVSTAENGTGFRVVDNSSYEQEREDHNNEQRAMVNKLIKESSPDDQLIYDLLKIGKSDAEIAKAINKSRSTVQARRVKLIAMLKEKVKSF